MLSLAPPGPMKKNCAGTMRMSICPWLFLLQSFPLPVGLQLLHHLCGFLALTQGHTVLFVPKRICIQAKKRHFTKILSTVESGQIQELHLPRMRSREHNFPYYPALSVHQKKHLNPSLFLPRHNKFAAKPPAVHPWSKQLQLGSCVTCEHRHGQLLQELDPAAQLRVCELLHHLNGALLVKAQECARLLCFVEGVPRDRLQSQRVPKHFAADHFGQCAAGFLNGDHGNTP
mmetsp:Transcript_89722/g.149892  ORF Transcript_89722/g.149892 Transcript_89722/m.149892 type:complete len:230 (-) Transcript_89722:47-736(-)